MLERVNRFRKEYDLGKPVGGILMNFLKEWFVEHLQTTDYRYVLFFQEKGVAKLPKDF
jgi:hemerythrin